VPGIPRSSAAARPFIHEIRTLTEETALVSETIDWARVLVLLAGLELGHEMVKDTLKRAPEILNPTFRRTLPHVTTFVANAARQTSSLTPMKENLASLLSRGARSGCAGLSRRKHRRDAGGAEIGLSDRSILRDTFLLTLAKSEDEKKALGACFDLFFAQPELSQPSANDHPRLPLRITRLAPTSGGEPTENLGPLAEMLLSQDRAAISAAVANASSAASLSGSGILTQRGLFSTRILDAWHRALRDDLDQLTTTSPALAERCRPPPKRCATTFARRFHSRCCSTVARKPKTSATKSCATRIVAIEPRQIEQMRALIARSPAAARALQQPRKRQRRGHLDVRRTIRRNAAGAASLPHRLEAPPARPARIVALCDVSGSVARVSDFLLLLIHVCMRCLGRCFVRVLGHLIEVSEILESKGAEERWPRSCPRSASVVRLWRIVRRFRAAMDGKRDVADTSSGSRMREQHLDPARTSSAASPSDRSGWFGSIGGRMTWGWGDSEMPRYLLLQRGPAIALPPSSSSAPSRNIVATYQ